jgi:hypothetical protein
MERNSRGEGGKEARVWSVEKSQAESWRGEPVEESLAVSRRKGTDEENLSVRRRKGQVEARLAVSWLIAESEWAGS